MKRIAKTISGLAMIMSVLALNPAFAHILL